MRSADTDKVFSGSISVEPRQAAFVRIVRPHIQLIVMVLILWFVCFYNLGGIDLIDRVDEGLYATAARQMIDSADWVTPRVGPDIFFYKPPLTCVSAGRMVEGFARVA